MRKCSETKRKNNDDKVMADLTAAFTYYQKLGYRSKKPTPQLLTLNNAHATINKRTRNGQPVPKSWRIILEQIYALPTENAWKKHQELQQKIKQDALRTQHQQDLMQYIPDVGVLKTVFGEAVYNKLLDKPIDPAAAMIFSEIVGTVTHGISDNIFLMLKLHSGYPVPTQNQPVENLGRGWSVQELGKYFGLTQPRVYAILAKECRRISTGLGKYLDCFINNDMETIFKDFSHITGLRQRYELYRKYKIHGINPKDLAFTGEWLNGAFIVKQK